MMKKVLVVDDTKNIRMLLTTCLELNDYQVVSASNGSDAIELFKSEKFDFAFLDIKLPGVSGTEVLRRIRDINITIPIVIMTAFATVRNAVECTKLGAVAYLQKPFTADKVKTVLKEMSNLVENQIFENIPAKLSEAENLITLGEYSKSYDILKYLLSIDPCYAKIYELLGKLYEKMDNPERSKRFYNAAQQFK
jgi:DNA-binding NtrC family response regulator